jgi:hypothetical protein
MFCRLFIFKNTVKTSMNDEYTHSTLSPLEGPNYIKKNMHKIKKNKKTTKHLIEE